MNDVNQLWVAFQKTPIPEIVAGQEGREISLIEVDTLAEGCISSFIKNAGMLDIEKKNTLGNCLSVLRKLNPTLVGDAQVYFGKLYRLCDLVYGRC